jgi:hypothetical protein
MRVAKEYSVWIRAASDPRDNFMIMPTEGGP